MASSIASPSPATARRPRPRRSGRRLPRLGCGRTRQRRCCATALPGATIVLDWWHAAVRFEHARQAARGLGVGTADASRAHDAVRTLDRAKWCLWHGRWTGCRRKLASLCRWTKRKPVRDMAGIGRLQRHVSDLLGYLERNRDALVPYAARRRRGEAISTA